MGSNPTGRTLQNILYMVSENLERMSCKSKEYYKNITAIDVTPVKTRDCSIYLVHKKGDTIVKRRLFRKPKVTTVVEDLYKFSDYYSPCSAKDLVRYHFYGTRYNEEKDFFYFPGEVKICFSNKKDAECHRFDTDEELKTFVNDLMEKCRKCGNELL